MSLRPPPTCPKINPWCVQLPSSVGVVGAQTMVCASQLSSIYSCGEATDLKTLQKLNHVLIHDSVISSRVVRHIYAGLTRGMLRYQAAR